MRKIESSGKTVVRDFVEFARRSEIAAEGLFDNNAGIFGQFRAAESLDDGCEQRRWNGQIVGGRLRLSECFPDSREGVGIAIIAADISSTARGACERRAGSSMPPALLKAIGDALVNLMPCSIG